jgi:DNA primase large subunit
MGHRPSLWLVLEIRWFSILTSFAVLGEIESSLYRNKTQKEMEVGLKHLFEKYMPMSSNTAQAGRGAQLDNERKKDHYSHFILRLAFCRSYVALSLQDTETNLI